jgi:hypothetical protein
LPPGVAGPVTTESGLGDVIAAGTYSIVDDRDARFLLDVTGKVKIPTADEKKGLGTGQFDYALQVDAYKSVGAFTALAGLGYRWLGDPPGIDFRNVWYGTLGATYRVQKGLSAGVTLDYREAALSTTQEQMELTPFISWRFAEQYKLQAYGVIGLKDGSPAWGLGTMIYRTF